MDTFTAIQERRSVKHYDPEHIMPEEDVRKLMEHALLSPTSFNMQNWRFVLVRDRGQLGQIEAAAWNQKQITESSLCIILCANKQAHAQDPARYWKDAPKEVQDMLVPMINGFYEGNDALQTGEANRSCGIAGQTIMLAAKAMGYDSCPMIGFDTAKVAEIINLPGDHMISFIVVVGKALKPANARGGQLPYDEVVIENRFA